MKTRLPVTGLFGNKFPSIYNSCGVMAACSRKTLKENFFAVFGKNRPLTGKFSKFCSERIHCDSDRRVVLKTSKFGRQVIDKINKNISPGSPALATARIAPKIYQSQPQLHSFQDESTCLRNNTNLCPSKHVRELYAVASAPDFIQIGSLLAELLTNAWTPSNRFRKWMQYSAEAQLRAE